MKTPMRLRWIALVFALSAPSFAQQISPNGLYHAVIPPGDASVLQTALQLPSGGSRSFGDAGVDPDRLARLFADVQLESVNRDALAQILRAYPVRRLAPLEHHLVIFMLPRRGALSVTAMLLVDATGRVQEVYVGEFTSEAFARQVALQMAAWRFPPPGSPCAVVIPIRR